MTTLSLSDIFAMEQIIDAQISPDGTQIAFVVTRDYSVPGYTTPESSIWCVPFDGSNPPRRLTFGSHADHFPRWSPDGRTLAFLSDREKSDVFQIYTLPLVGGEACRLTNVKGGVTSFKWSPDGKALAFVTPDAPNEAEEQRLKLRDDADFVNHNYKFSRLWVLDYPAKDEVRAITPAEYQVQDFAWYKEGWVILISQTPLLDEMQGWTILSIQENQAPFKLAQVKYSTYGLNGSADGQSLAWIDSGCDAKSSATELWVIHQGSAPKCVAQDYAGGMLWTDWHPDGESLLIIAVDGTHTRLGQLKLGGDGKVEDLTLPMNIAEIGSWRFRLSISGDGQRLGCVLEDGTNPTAIWGVTLNGEVKQLSFFNSHLEGVSLGKTETIRWKAEDGREIEGVLIYPSGYEPGKRYPLVADIHGGPTWYWLDRFMGSWHDWGQWLAANGYAVLLPNPRGSAGRGQEFAWCNRQNWGWGDFGDVLTGIDLVIERGIADADRLGIGGWSYGGFMTAWAIGHTNRFKAAVVGAGVTNLLSFQASDISHWLPTQQMLINPYTDPTVYLRSSPINYIADVTTPTLVIHGAADERVRLGQGRELYHGLRILKKQVEMVVYPREPHTLGELHHQQDMLQRVVNWFDQFLKVLPEPKPVVSELEVNRV